MSSPLKNPAFARLWAAGLFAESAEWMLQVALPVFVYQATGSASSTALTMVAGVVPMVLLSPLAGFAADRYDRRVLLCVVCFAQAAVALPLLSGQGGLVLAVMAAQSALASLFEPVRNALVPALVGPHQLLAANGLMGMNSSVARLAGSSLGGAVLGFAGLGWVIAVYLGLLLLAGSLLLPRFAVHTVAASPRGRLGGFADIAHNPVLRVTAATTALMSVAQGMFLVLFVVFVTGPLGGGEAEVGLLRGVQAVGGFAAGAALATVARRTGPARLLGWGTLVLGLLSLAIWNGPPVTTALAVYAGLFAVAGAPAVITGSGLMSLLQQEVPPGRLGRVSSTFFAGMAAFQVVGMLAAGALTGSVGLGGLLDAQAALYVIAGLVVLAGPRPRVANVGECPVSTPPATST
ncbi:putative MFS family arabinose efflux permease [Amycolatopsis bartoniae]|uniref:MFS transporter n=1 Tax=Amycolatopsis bartoniae TaxID=941986 RepID=A0A8H9IR82_9PSEU|nr:MFS transporter [Amycolatopsis bartoniae]MBB2936974.1 putative MFS family arabinose efflux permease [Amycolatopsis bartoniae]TVT06443.1 MFS transporter [Amycolatopsis bartoniae]GHF51563.1 MFS transporter [Amycolatopsis bartoniae]